MNSIKCPNCGLVNFETATECKRCKQNFEARSYPYWQGNAAVGPPTPDWSRLQTVSADAPNLNDHGDGSHTVGNIVFAVYLVLNMLVLFYAVIFFSSRQMNEVLRAVSVPKTKLYLASFEPLYYLVILGVAIFLPGSIILLVRLFQKSEAFLKSVVIYLLAEFLYSLVQLFLVYSLSGDLRAKQIPQFDLAADQIQSLMGLNVISILITFIWFRYFTTSKRARMVFEFEYE